MEQLAENIWYFEDDLFLLGVNIGAKMTVIKLENNQLFIHSPIALNDLIKKQIKELGTVKWILAPNTFHHLFVKPWMDNFQEAKLIAPKKLAKKRPDLKIDFAISKTSEFPEIAGIEYQIIQGAPLAQEILIFHQASQTLLVTDCFFHLPDEKGLAGLYAKIGSLDKKPGKSLAWRFIIKNKSDYKASFKKVINWQPKIISIPHKKSIHSKACEHIEEALAKL